MLVHTVLFWLKEELTDAQRSDFRQGVETLSGISHADSVHVGAPAATPARPVVDQSYDFALTVLLADIPAHDAYQEDPIHLAFVKNFAHCWTRVLVYDAE